MQSYGGVIEMLCQPFGLPTVLIVVAIYTILCELYPEYINNINSNVSTSLIRFNIALPSLNYQIMNYFLYHRRWCSKFIHGITLPMDGLLWNIYFQHLVNGSSRMAFYAIVFFLAAQVFTYNDNQVRYTLFVLQLSYFVAGAIVYPLLRNPQTSFTWISIVLCINAELRVVSHYPEAMPINYFNWKNQRPVYRWYAQLWVWKSFLTKPIYCIYGLFIGFLSELQAGLPTRLLCPAWMTILYQYCNFSTEKVNIRLVENTAELIYDRGYSSPDALKTDKPYFKWMDFQPIEIDFEKGMFASEGQTANAVDLVEGPCSGMEVQGVVNKVDKRRCISPGYVKRINLKLCKRQALRFRKLGTLRI